MKITFLIHSLYYGGTERQLVTLAKGLHDQGHSVLVTVFYRNGPLEKDLHDGGVQVQGLDKRGRWDMLNLLLRLIRLLRKENPDILYGHLGVPNLLAVIVKPLFPRMKMVWGVRASNLNRSRYDWLSYVIFKACSRLSRFPQLIIVNSHAGMAFHCEQGYPPDKTSVIHNGTDIEHFCPDHEARQLVRAEWQVAKGEKLIGIVGRLNPVKDHPTFLRAASLLAQEREDVHFVCVGAGPTDYWQELQSLAKELRLTERLIWAGAREDMPAVYNALDIATSSSYSEGFSNVICEAMACGVPCVATDVGDSARIVGELGVVVPAQDPKELANGWKTCLSLLPRDEPAVSRRIRERVKQKFSKEHLVESTVKVLEELL